MNGILSFQVVGYQVTFYYSYLAPHGVYIMLEVAHAQIPASHRDIESSVFDMDELLGVVTIFTTHCVPLTREQAEAKAVMRRATLSTPQFKRVIEPSTYRRRRSITSHYHDV
ncbi:uncharacterized protein BX664DRAFT_330457 [Halteromyces radiatus]|uniref:uncharacterized protein n=1 Tax=Halteromyces radiatus TaxID=101107 RepID=UPI00221F66AA|nr:uncharacterized protein BX664DRAFT_330457 [Halteromyces radiatus]KAI8093734.1 hypothetical protein BX664DRAFT_330457 [Halteromyces radiatus]